MEIEYKNRRIEQGKTFFFIDCTTFSSQDVKEFSNSRVTVAWMTFKLSSKLAQWPSLSWSHLIATFPLCSGFQRLRDRGFFRASQSRAYWASPSGGLESAAWDDMMSIGKWQGPLNWNRKITRDSTLGQHPQQIKYGFRQASPDFVRNFLLVITTKISLPICLRMFNGFRTRNFLPRALCECGLIRLTMNSLLVRCGNGNSRVSDETSWFRLSSTL